MSEHDALTSRGLARPSLPASPSPQASLCLLASKAARDRRARFAVSVVVPTCGRPQLLHRCLAALARQRLPGDYEVIVVDDRPAAATREVVACWADRARNAGPVIRYVASPGPHGPAAARNHGWRSARAGTIAFTDDDTEPDADWLRKGLAAFADDVETVCGRIVMPGTQNPTDYERDARRLENGEFVTANCLCRKRTLERLGGFDERFLVAWREDSDLHFRLLQAGARIVYANDAIVVHPLRPAGWGVSIGQQRKVMFDALLFKKHPLLYRQRIRATPRWDYYAIVAALFLALLGFLAPAHAWPWVALATWALLTARFCRQRLRGTSRTPRHVAEMLLTSALIPPLAVYWRLVGALRFRVAAFL